MPAMVRLKGASLGFSHGPPSFNASDGPIKSRRRESRGRTPPPVSMPAMVRLKVVNVAGPVMVCVRFNASDGPIKSGVCALAPSFPDLFQCQRWSD